MPIKDFIEELEENLRGLPAIFMLEVEPDSQLLICPWSRRIFFYCVNIGLEVVYGLLANLRIFNMLKFLL
jgi:hypothetical protein